jgi:hypothetical protein
MLELQKVVSRWSLVVRQSLKLQLLCVGQRPTTNDQRRSPESF